MTVSVYTVTPRFVGDIADVLRVFYGGITLFVNEAGGEHVLRHTQSEQNGERTCTVTLDGQTLDSTQSVCTDTLLDKRLHKRQIKLLVYQLLKAQTGRTPPWGALTGIRPTHMLYEGLADGLTMDEAAQRVTRVFDVAPEKAALLQEIVQVQQALPISDDASVDVYIGIPFCVSRCAYCSFLSGEVGSGKQLPPYVDALEREISAVKRLMDEKGLRARAIYVGGGTPTALPAPLLARVLAAVRPWAETAVEFTVEAGRPDTIDAEKLRVIIDSGARRISVNPQTMHDETLVRIGRRHTTAQTEQAYAMARKIGFAHINMDLIAGLPGENADMFAQTLAWARQLAPESLTVHTLSIKRSSLLHLWEAQLPDGDMVARMVRMGAQCAHDMGMRAYYLYRQKYMAGNLENVGYALPGHACLYNVGMMEETDSVLAMGAGAVSKRVFREQNRIERAPNVSDIAHYLARVDEMAERKKTLWQDKAKEDNA